MLPLCVMQLLHHLLLMMSWHGLCLVQKSLQKQHSIHSHCCCSSLAVTCSSKGIANGRVSPGCLVLPQQKKQNKQKQQQKLQFSIRCRKQDIHIPFLQSSFLFLLRAVIWQLSNSLLLMINPARALLNLAATISLPRGILFSQLLPIC